MSLLPEVAFPTQPPQLKMFESTSMFFLKGSLSLGKNALFNKTTRKTNLDPPKRYQNKFFATSTPAVTPRKKVMKSIQKRPAKK